MIRVKKRDGTYAPWDTTKIRKVLQWANIGLDSIQYLELESHVENVTRDGISTQEIQQSLVSLALKMTTVEKPEWRIFAARLQIMDLYKEASYHRGTVGHGYSDYLEFVKLAVSKGLYDKVLLDYYTEDEISQAGKLIQADYDMQFDYAGIHMIMNRYLIQDRRKPFELPQEMFLTIALFLASPEKKEDRMAVVEKFYHQIAGRKISLATPILINLRVPGGNLSSCFITAVDDSLDNIFYNISAIAQISKNGGGVGVNLSRIRSSGGEIRSVPNASGGVIPWIKIVNDTAVAVNQLGKRSGAVTVALDVWHRDIEDFLELQTENGDQRKKAYDLFPQIVIPDLFMERVKADADWTLLDPDEIRRIHQVELAELWGEEFTRAYKQFETDSNLIQSKKVKARDVFKRAMKSQLETGMPYMFFKDTVNAMNPNKHDGMIGSGNLCQESFSNFKPSKIIGEKLQDDTITREVEAGLIHTCNLVSLNLALLLERQDLAESCAMAVRILDNTIELTVTPVQESNRHNHIYRTIGVGAMGFADYLAHKELVYGSPESVSEADKLFEWIAYHAVQASMELSRDRGAYPKFEGSDWSKGICFGRDGKALKANTHLGDRWEVLISDIQKHGIRNSQLLAIAPNTSSALVQGCTSSVMPIFNKFYLDKNAKGSVPITPPFIKDAFWYYRENKNLDQRDVVDVIAAIQKWVDQGISFELLHNLNRDIRAKDIYETLVKAWEQKCKTIYYTRTIQKATGIMSEKEECVSCAN